MLITLCVITVRFICHWILRYDALPADRVVFIMSVKSQKKGYLLVNVDGQIRDIPVVFAAFGQQLRIPKKQKEVCEME